MLCTNKLQLEWCIGVFLVYWCISGVLVYFCWGCNAGRHNEFRNRCPAIYLIDDYYLMNIWCIGLFLVYWFISGGYVALAGSVNCTTGAELIFSDRPDE